MCYLRSVRLYPQLLVGGLMCYLRSVRLYPQILVGGLMCYLRHVLFTSCVIYVQFVFTLSTSN
jgi:hypothetical protein